MRQQQPTPPPPPPQDEEDEVQGDDDDAVKTFCTEGTPAYTPFLGSAATSMSDLRDLDHDNNGESPPGKGIMFGAAQHKKMKVKMRHSLKDQLTIALLAHALNHLNQYVFAYVLLTNGVL